jgi:hypothetical protein
MLSVLLWHKLLALERSQTENSEHMGDAEVAELTAQAAGVLSAAPGAALRTLKCSGDRAGTEADGTGLQAAAYVLGSPEHKADAAQLSIAEAEGIISQVCCV